jgi:hypothetical protein
MSKKLISKIVQVAYHRNGVGGAGFHAVIFETENRSCICGAFASLGVNGLGVDVCIHQRDEGHPPFAIVTKTARMVASVFDEPGHVAVYQIDKLSDPDVGVRFGENSWRGDQYETELREAIGRNESDGSVRIGPFALPTPRRAR